MRARTFSLTLQSTVMLFFTAFTMGCKRFVTIDAKRKDLELAPLADEVYLGKLLGWRSQGLKTWTIREGSTSRLHTPNKIQVCRYGVRAIMRLWTIR